LLKPDEEDRASSFKALAHPFIFNSPNLLELQKAWPYPYDQKRVRLLDAQQLTPKQYISKHRYVDEEISDSDSNVGEVLNLLNIK